MPSGEQQVPRSEVMKVQHDGSVRAQLRAVVAKPRSHPGGERLLGTREQEPQVEVLEPAAEVLGQPEGGEDAAAVPVVARAGRGRLGLEQHGGEPDQHHRRHELHTGHGRAVDAEHAEHARDEQEEHRAQHERPRVADVPGQAREPRRVARRVVVSHHDDHAGLPPALRGTHVLGRAAWRDRAGRLQDARHVERGERRRGQHERGPKRGVRDRHQAALDGQQCVQGVNERGPRPDLEWLELRFPAQLMQAGLEVSRGPALCVAAGDPPGVLGQRRDLLLRVHPAPQGKVAPRRRIEPPAEERAVDASRLSFGEQVAGASGLALLIFLFFPWYVEDAGLGPENMSAWSAFGFIDLLLFLIATLAIAMAVARAARLIPTNLPAPPGTIVAAAGALAALLVLYRLLELPSPAIADADIGRKVGVYLGLIASLGIAFGGVTAMNESSPGRRRRR
jgi:hypothetical protein